jgi:hypothetical protein
MSTSAQSIGKKVYSHTVFSPFLWKWHNVKEKDSCRLKKRIKTHKVSSMLSSCPEPCIPLQPDEAEPPSSELALDEVNWPFLRCILTVTNILEERYNGKHLRNLTKQVNKITERDRASGGVWFHIELQVMISIKTRRVSPIRHGIRKACW